MYDMNGALPCPLHCPYCGSELEVDAELVAAGGRLVHGILACACYRYPVLEGIPILRQTSSVGSNRDPVVELLATGDVAGAITVATGPPADPEPEAARGFRAAIARLRGRLANGPARASRPAAALEDRFAPALYARRPRAYADYLYYRHANISFMSAQILVCLLRDGLRERAAPTLLDLSCGIGHASFLAGALFPGLRVVGADWDFLNLRIARRFVCPEAALICLDAELPLPFGGGSFEACLCLDGLHYIRSKVALLAELDRILTPDALWLFPHMHNARQRNAAPGVPLDPAAWGRLLAFLPHRILSESLLVRGFADLDAIDLSTRAGTADLEASPSMAAVATRREDFWRVHDRLSTTLAARPDTLGFNPIFEVSRGARGVGLQARWPTEAFERECAESLAVLPTKLTLDSPTPWDSSRREELVRRFAIVNVPPGYR